ncbi:MAG: hypothetical protein JOZ47_12700, partial [Kutzneria sp.]|nr:hypothetical protein [Kutzneria sp.]
EGIGLGSTVAEAKAAFPGYHDGSPYTNDGAPVPGNSRAYYGIGRRAGDSGRIISLYLASNDERCFNN